ncbi:uncharacterized protein G2W53_029108 [Senna tora]|uniref:Uncharacterized protein n=1 Tax=Senna tora TaxID=362788 RepID=A0A834T3K8_9FABA|nr:uncharacterized protein G2W53_029108 [Senna tora]
MTTIRSIATVALRGTAYWVDEKCPLPLEVPNSRPNVKGDDNDDSNCQDSKQRHISKNRSSKFRITEVRSGTNRCSG